MIGGGLPDCATTKPLCQLSRPALCKARQEREIKAMTDLPGIVVTGASGRMGQMLIRTIVESGRARLVGALERKGHDWIGRDVGTAMGGAEMGVTVTDD